MKGCSLSSDLTSRNVVPNLQASSRRFKRLLQAESLRRLSLPLAIWRYSSAIQFLGALQNMSLMSISMGLVMRWRSSWTIPELCGRFVVVAPVVCCNYWIEFARTKTIADLKDSVLVGRRAPGTCQNRSEGEGIGMLLEKTNAICLVLYRAQPFIMAVMHGAS